MSSAARLPRSGTDGVTEYLLKYPYFADPLLGQARCQCLIASLLILATYSPVSLSLHTWFPRFPRLEPVPGGTAFPTNDFKLLNVARMVFWRCRSLASIDKNTLNSYRRLFGSQQTNAAACFKLKLGA